VNEVPSKLGLSVLTAFPGEAVAASWRECLASADFPTHYTSPEFFLEPFFLGRAPFAVLAIQGHRVLGVLTGLKEAGRVDCGMTLRPQVCCHRDASFDEVSGALAEGLLSHLDRRDRYLNVCSWCRMAGFERLGFRHRQHADDQGIVVLDLGRGPDQLFKQFSEMRRRNIRRAIKSGVEVKEYEEHRDLDEYYEILQHWCNFKQLPLPAYETQRSAFRLQGNRLVLVARHEGRMIGVSIFRFQPGGLVEYSANCSRREDTKVRPNDLLMWRAIEWAAANRFRQFSMAGAHLFLRNFGGQIVTTQQYTLDRSFMRVHDLKESFITLRRSMFHFLPPGVQTRVRRRLGRTVDAD
jgi:hypothetical protein